jgi:hypothetical protein
MQILVTRLMPAAVEFSVVVAKIEAAESDAGGLQCKIFVTGRPYLIDTPYAQVNNLMANA